MFFINPFIYAGGGDFESIATTALGSDAASVTFSSLGSYQHLQLRAIVKGAAGNITTALRFNSVSTTSYVGHVLRGNGSSASAGASTGRTNIPLHDDHSNTTNLAAFVCDILDYGSTSKTTTVRTFFGFDNNGSGQVGLWSGFYNSTDAVTSLTLIDANGGNLKSGSEFALYGVKAP